MLPSEIDEAPASDVLLLQRYFAKYPSMADRIDVAQANICFWLYWANAKNPKFKPKDFLPKYLQIETTPKTQEEAAAQAHVIFGTVPLNI